jgi:hypothetical protein
MSTPTAEELQYIDTLDDWEPVTEDDLVRRKANWLVALGLALMVLAGATKEARGNFNNISLPNIKEPRELNSQEHRDQALSEYLSSSEKKLHWKNIDAYYQNDTGGVSRIKDPLLYTDAQTGETLLVGLKDRCCSTSVWPPEFIYREFGAVLLVTEDGKEPSVDAITSEHLDFNPRTNKLRSRTGEDVARSFSVSNSSLDIVFKIESDLSELKPFLILFRDQNSLVDATAGIVPQ